jgi:hypothetical protein
VELYDILEDLMGSWTKETALSELDELIKEIGKLSTQYRYSADHMRWIARTLAFLEEVFGRDSRYYLTLASFHWSETISYPIRVSAADPQGDIEKINHTAYLRQLESAKGLLQAASDHLKRTALSSVYQGKDTAPESSAILRIINIAERKLRKVIRDIPSREKEIQDAFENLLIGADIPYSRETESIEYSSKTYTPDFTIQKIDLAIEIKLCPREGREKEIIGEVNDDILAYQTKYGNLLFVVYDVGFIRDADRFIDVFEKNQNVIVRVVKH